MRSVRKSGLLITCSAHIVQDGLASTTFVLLPILAQSFGLSYAQIGLLKGINNLALVALEPGSGWFAERIGEVRLILIGLGLASTGYLLLPIAQNLSWIAICLLLIGAGAALHHAPSSSFIAKNCHQFSHSGPLGIYNASGDVGKLVFAGLFSLAVSTGFIWHQISLAFGVIGCVATLAVAVVARSFSNLPKKTMLHHSDDRQQELVSRWGVMDWRSFGALLMAAGIDTLVQTSIFVFMPLLMLSKGFSLSLASFATVILLAGGVFGKAGCGFIADRLGVRSAFFLIQVLTIVGLISIVMAPTWLVLGLLLPLGIFAQGSTSITYGLAGNLIHPERMARGYALLYSSGSFTATVGPMTIGWVADRFGIEYGLYVLAVITLLSIPPMLTLSMSNYKTA